MKFKANIIDAWSRRLIWVGFLLLAMGGGILAAKYSVTIRESINAAAIANPVLARENFLNGKSDRYDGWAVGPYMGGR